MKRFPLKRTIQWITLIIPAVTAVLLGSLCAVYAGWVHDLPPLSELEAGMAVPSSYILDREGRVIFELVHPDVGKHTPLSLEQFSPWLRDAMVAVEDATYYQHPGFSVRGIARAAWLNLRAGEVVAGGSTITQQVARNLLLSPEERYEKTVRRKVREITLAIRLDQRFSKDEILALYLNQTYFGNLAFGAEAAAQAYFGVSAAELDLAQSALLAGLIQSPVYYNPLENPEAAKARQRVVLDLMVQNGSISQEERELAENEPLYYASSPFPYLEGAPHFATYVAGLLERELGVETLRQGGLRIYTTLDIDVQRAVQDVVRRRLAELNEPDEQGARRRVDNAAVVVLEPATGEILAMLGSPDYSEARISGAMNATLALRQPGSALKPFTYAAAFSRGYTPASMIPDVFTVFHTEDGKSYVPQNYDLTYHGPVLARTALASSFNVPAVKVLEDIGVDAVVDLCTRFGITSFSSSERYGLTLTLGGGEVSLLELTTAYAGLAAGGRRVERVAIRRVEDAQGNVLRTWSGGPSTAVLSPQVAYLITDILSDAEARRPGFGANPWLRIGRPAAVKTGTTTDWRDNWTLGYTPDLVVGVWVGNADNTPMYGVSGVSGAGPIWHDVMLLAHEGRPAAAFPRPDGLVELDICPLSGMLPSPDCPYHIRELFIAGTEPAETCSMHRRFVLDAQTGALADEHTPSARRVEKVFALFPPEVQEWARQSGYPAPPDSSAVSVASRPAAAGGPALELLNPLDGTRYRLSTGLPRDVQRIELTAAPRRASFSSVEIYVDGVQLASFESPPYTARWSLVPGRHRMWARGLTLDGEWIESPAVEIWVEEK